MAELDMDHLQTLSDACQGLGPDDVKAAIAASKHASAVRDPDALAAYLCSLAQPPGDGTAGA